jgi:4-methylaminobutanoate oxidase (formaldehyde-forming)
VRGVRVSKSSTDDDGVIECEAVVNCTGMWARELGEKTGCGDPQPAAEHYYLITDTIGDRPGAPIFRGPGVVRLLPRGGGMMVGLSSRTPLRGLSTASRAPSFTTQARLGPDEPVPEPRWPAPVRSEVGVRTFFCGPESFTPDLMPAVGGRGSACASRPLRRPPSACSRPAASAGAAH